MDFGKIKLLIFDCDGVFTDGRIIYNNHRVESKNFDAKDGMGIKIAHYGGLKVAMITGRKSSVVAQRCRDLNFDFLYQGVWGKLKATEEIFELTGLSWENTAYLGDDWNDYPVMKRVSFSGVPADTLPALQARVDYVCIHKGGRGAVREFVEKILREQKRYEETLEKLLSDLESSFH